MKRIKSKTSSCKAFWMIFLFGGGETDFGWWGVLDMCNIYYVYYVYYVYIFLCFLLESNKHAYPFFVFFFVFLPRVFGIGCRQTS